MKLKLTVDDLYQINPMGAPSPLKDAYEAGLPFRTSVTIKRLMDDVGKELGTYEPERVKIIKEFGTPAKDEEGKVIKDKYDLPKQTTKKGREYIEKITEFATTIIEVTYSPIDIDALADNPEMKDKVIPGAFTTLVDQLNDLCKRQEEEANKPKEEEKPAE